MAEKPSSAIQTGAGAAARLEVPSDYVDGYANARLANPDLADNYIAHMHIGDPPAEEMVDDLEELAPQSAWNLIEAAMQKKGEGALRQAPASLRRFFKDTEAQPDWVDLAQMDPGIRMFHHNTKIILAAFVAGVLVEGFATNIAKSFFITGRVRDSGVRRLGQNNRHLLEIFLPGGLERDGDGWKLSVRIRIIHARVRRLLQKSGDWNTEAWGMPISAAHLGFAISAFSARLLKHMKALGVKCNDREEESFMAVWRYTGYLMGIPESILFRDEQEALKIYEMGRICEPDCPMESIVMAHSLVNSAPLLAGTTEPDERRSLARYIYRVSCCLIGKKTAGQLMYPPVSPFGVAWWFRVQNRYGYLLESLFPRIDRQDNFKRFTSLIDVGTYDEEGIHYRLPDHVYAEESSTY